jgi:hypothetical protein
LAVVVAAAAQARRLVTPVYPAVREAAAVVAVLVLHLVAAELPGKATVVVQVIPKVCQAAVVAPAVQAPTG